MSLVYPRYVRSTNIEVIQNEKSRFVQFPAVGSIVKSSRHCRRGNITDYFYIEQINVTTEIDTKILIHPIVLVTQGGTFFFREENQFKKVEGIVLIDISISISLKFFRTSSGKCLITSLAQDQNIYVFINPKELLDKFAITLSQRPLYDDVEKELVKLFEK